jgi:uncharacterized repeat protein (TIGR03803 family)
MNNGKRFTLRVSMMCFGIALGAVIILAFSSVARTVWAQNPTTETVVFDFTPATGYYPTSVIRDASGNFDVATSGGGGNPKCTSGCGNILKLSSSGKPTVLYSFLPTFENTGPGPIGLVRDAIGSLYGSTDIGGQYRAGTVFKLTPSGAEGILHSFGGENDGNGPSSGGLAIDSAGNLYGGTVFGGQTNGCDGNGCGIVYKVSPSGVETILHSFTGGTDGAIPQGIPVLDASGNLYGVAANGANPGCDEGFGCGTIYKVDTAGNFTVLYSFTGDTDGDVPVGGPVLDSSGNLYGTTTIGGNLSCSPPNGCGVVFKIDSSGNFTVLYTFNGGSNDGEGPNSTLLLDFAGNLYGTTGYGGDLSCDLNEGGGCGVVFKVDPSGEETILHAFAGGTGDGADPTNGPLTSDGKGNLYGTTSFGGVANGGVIFALRE